MVSSWEKSHPKHPIDFGLGGNEREGTKGDGRETLSCRTLLNERDSTNIWHLAQSRLNCVIIRPRARSVRGGAVGKMACFVSCCFRSEFFVFALIRMIHGVAMPRVVFDLRLFLQYCQRRKKGIDPKRKRTVLLRLVVSKNHLPPLDSMAVSFIRPGID